MEGNEIAFIHRKAFTFHDKHYIDMIKTDEHTIFEDEHFIQVHDNFVVEGFGWKINGSLFSHDFQILGDDGHLIAESHKNWITVTDKYVVNVVDETQTEKVIAIMMTLALTGRDREEADTAVTAVGVNEVIKLLEK